MIRDLLAERDIGRRATFRWRGTDVSRIEGFSDGVFAFALTLLVVSLDVPDTFDQLSRAMLNFPSFALCFLLLIQVWYAHYTYFRRYGLEDPMTVGLNAMLLFVVLFYIYPLKFLFTRLVDLVLGIDALVPLPDGSMVLPIGDQEWPRLMMFFAAGYVACFLFFLLLYVNAWTRRDRLELTPVEVLETRASINSNLAHLAIGVVAFVIAAFGFPMWSGLTFWLLWPILLLHGRYIERRRKELEALMLQSTPTNQAQQGEPRTENREPRTEDREPRTENRGQGPQDRGQRTGNRGQRNKGPGTRKQVQQRTVEPE